MRRILLDQNVPRPLRRFLFGHVHTATEMGWAELTNGKLIAAAEETGFEVLITCDQNLPHQQNLTLRRIAIIVLGTNKWRIIEKAASRIAQQAEVIESGRLTVLLRSDLPTSHEG